ncbi:MAG: hypothetical protein CMM44_03390 [Rhodospirillaceae bacterium]|nr:hypothetical protein [Rhodospirillaceae bacterium]
MKLLHLSRRQVIKGMTAGSFIASFDSAVSAVPRIPIRILWTGVTFMRSCPIESASCKELDDYFPHTWATLSSSVGNSEKIHLLDKVVFRSVAPITGKYNNIRMIFPGPENSFGASIETNLGMFVGISSDRDIAHHYVKSENQLVQIAELQTYVIVFDIKNYSIIQSYPLRFVGIDSTQKKNRREFVKKMQWETLVGTGSNEKSLSRALAKTLKKLVVNQQKPVGVRVTRIQLKGVAKKWLEQEPTASKHTESDYREILGNALTSAISEKLQIGIQPFSPADSIMRVTDSMVNKSSELLDKDFNNGNIDWDIRLTAFGTQIQNKRIAGRKYLFNRRIDIFVGISVGKYKRSYADEQRLIEIKEDQILEKEVFKNKFHAVSIEETTGTWSNNWFYALDLHTRLFEWLFENLRKENYALIFNGEQKNLKTRRFLTKAHSHNFSQFKEQAKALRNILI